MRAKMERRDFVVHLNYVAHSQSLRYIYIYIFFLYIIYIYTDRVDRGNMPTNVCYIHLKVVSSWLWRVLTSAAWYCQRTAVSSYETKETIESWTYRSPNILFSVWFRPLGRCRTSHCFLVPLRESYNSRSMARCDDFLQNWDGKICH